ncbi:hypothetical protein ACFL6X_07140 [Candidatus Latescibacterota bacterium]
MTRRVLLAGAMTLALTSMAAAETGEVAGGGAWIGVLGGLAQLIIGVPFALLSITYGARVLDRLTKQIDIMVEIRNKNLAVGALFAGVVVSFANTVSSGIGHLSQGVAKLGELGVTSGSAWAAVGMSLVAILVGFVAAVIGITWAMNVLKKMFGRVAGFDVEQSLKEGNTSLGFLLGAAMYAISTVLSTGVEGVSQALIGM